MVDHKEGGNTLDQMDIEDIGRPEQHKSTWCERKQAAVDEEMKRMSQLPANSTYVVHRRRVLNKILQLMTMQRTVSRGGAGATFCWAVFVKNFQLTMVRFCRISFIIFNVSLMKPSSILI